MKGYALNILTNGRRISKTSERPLGGHGLADLAVSGAFLLKASTGAESLLTLFLSKGDRR